jgi:site-specific DNA recombinase
MATRVVFYLRLSSSDEASTSIARQEADLRAHAERSGWDIVRVLTDDGFSGRKARDNAEEALRMLRDDEADVLAVWKFDRWSRQGLGAVASLIATLDSRPSALFVALNDGLNSSQPAWRIIASVLAEVARMEADNTSMRVKSAVKTMRHSGRFPGGVVPFGYWPAENPDGPGRILAPNLEEATTIRQVAERILAGDSLTRVAADLHDAGVPTPRSDYRLAQMAGRPTEGLDKGAWRISTIRLVWTADYLLGRVTDGGALIRDDDGLPLQVWTPILDLVKLTALRARLGNPAADSRRIKEWRDEQKANPSRSLPRPQTLARPRSEVRRAARILSGFAFCAHCGHKLYVGTIGGRPSYRCPQGGAPNLCPGVRVMAEPLEGYVTDVFLKVAGDWPEVDQRGSVSESGTAEALAEVQSAIQETLAALGDDEGDSSALNARLESLKARRAQLRALPETQTVENVLTGRTLAEAWHADDDVVSRRATLAWALDHLTVSKAVARGNQFDPARVREFWTS